MYSGLFIHSPTKEHLDCFQVLTVMKKAMINISLQILCEHKFGVMWVIYIGVQMPDHIVRACLTL